MTELEVKASELLLCSLPPLCCAADCLSACLSAAGHGVFAFLQHIHIHDGSGSLHVEVCVCVCLRAGFNWAVVRGDPPHRVPGGEGAGIPLFRALCIFSIVSLLAAPARSGRHEASFHQAEFSLIRR